MLFVAVALAHSPLDSQRPFCLKASISPATVPDGPVRRQSLQRLARAIEVGAQVGVRLHLKQAEPGDVGAVQRGEAER